MTVVMVVCDDGDYGGVMTVFMMVCDDGGYGGGYEGGYGNV